MRLASLLDMKQETENILVDSQKTQSHSWDRSLHQQKKSASMGENGRQFMTNTIKCPVCIWEKKHMMELYRKMLMKHFYSNSNTGRYYRRREFSNF